MVVSTRGAGGTAYAEFLYVAPRLDEIPPGAITTIAGIGAYTRLFGPAKSAPLNPEGLAFDAHNNLYATQTVPGTVIAIRSDGSIEKIAGTGDVLSPIGDGGPAVDASISFPRSIAVDDAGYAYVPDVHYRIRRIEPASGIITTIAGTGTKGYSGDGGAATSADIGEPTFLAVEGDSVYFIDFNAMRVRRIRNGGITTYAGNGIAGFSGDGALATLASFDVGVEDNGGLAVDSAGNLYIGDSKNRRIRRIDRVTNIITTFVDASDRNSAWFADHFENIAIDRRTDHLYYGGNGSIREFDAAGRYLRSLHGAVEGTTIDGPLATAYIGSVVGIAVDTAGHIAFSDAALGRIRRIDPVAQTIETVAGIGPGILGENGPANATLTYPRDLAWSITGELLVADSCCAQQQRLRKLDAAGILTTIAGGGLLPDDFTPRPALQDFLDSVVSVVPDSEGNLDFVSWAAGVVRRLDPQGKIRQIVGKRSRCGYAGDGGPAAQAELCQPWAARRDKAGNLFIADTNNNRIRRVDAQSGVITTVVGSGPAGSFEHYNSGSFCGDGGPAVDACINTPYGIAFDPAGNLYISEGQRVRRVDPAGTITTHLPGGAVNAMVFDHGFLYSAQFAELHRFDRSGRKTILAGTGKAGFSGDGGAAVNAQVAISLQGAGIAIDADGNIFFGDANRIRAIRQGAFLAPADATITMTRSGSSIAATVSDAAGNHAPSVRVDFDAPRSGPSCSLASTFAITDSNGVATVTCIPNCLAGSYSVTARPLAATALATVSLMNIDQPCRRRSARH